MKQHFKINAWFLILALVLGFSFTNEPKVVVTELITIKSRGEGMVTVDLRKDYDLVVGVRLDVQIPLDTVGIKYRKL